MHRDSATRDVLPARRMPRRRRLFACAAILGMCGLMFAIAEISLRMKHGIDARRARAAMLAAPSSPMAGWAMYDPDLGYRNRPSWRDHNEAGMRDHPIRPKGGFRILMLGDSIGYYGQSPDETFPGRLEALLRADPACRSSEVLNTSTKGYTNYQQLLYLKKFGLRFEPDLVGVGFCLNDLHRFTREFVVTDGEIVPGTYLLSREARQNLYGHGYIGALRQRSAAIDWLVRYLPPALSRLGIGSAYKFEVLPAINAAWHDDAWRRVETQLADMQTLCRDHGASLFVVIFPLEVQYRPSYLKRDRDYVLKPQRELAAICRRLNIPFVDLYADLAGPGHFDEDGLHLSAAGRAITAQSIYRFLKDSHLVPRDAAH